MASFTSSPLPAASANGWFISVSNASVGIPAWVPTAQSESDNSRATVMSVMNAPFPTLMSITNDPRPAASFFDKMLAVINPYCSTVAVTSRVAYMRRSAGAKSSVWPAMANPHRSTAPRNVDSSGAVVYPGMDSSLSIVPPVCANPRPAIMGTKPPHAAKIGASTNDTVSPTPPVECLSNTGPPNRSASQLSTLPESRMANVRSVRSRYEMS